MFSYQNALEILKDRAQKKVANNTYLVRTSPDCIGVRLHDTIVVYLFADGTTRLNSGGYQTNTTKNRINCFSPLRVQQVKNVWSVWKPSPDYKPYRFIGLFKDFITVDSAGRKTL